MKWCTFILKVFQNSFNAKSKSVEIFWTFYNTCNVFFFYNCKIVKKPPINCKVLTCFTPIFEWWVIYFYVKCTIWNKFCNHSFFYRRVIKEFHRSYFTPLQFAKIVVLYSENILENCSSFSSRACVPNSGDNQSYIFQVLWKLKLTSDSKKPGQTTVVIQYCTLSRFFFWIRH